jgi:hypothetical protein
MRINKEYQWDIFYKTKMKEEGQKANLSNILLDDFRLSPPVFLGPGITYRIFWLKLFSNFLRLPVKHPI